MKNILRSISDKISPKMRIRGDLHTRWQNLLADGLKSSRELGALNIRLKSEQSKPEYAPLVRMLEEKAELLRQIGSIDRGLNDAQVVIAKMVGVDPSTIHNYSVDTKSGVVTRNKEPESETT